MKDEANCPPKPDWSDTGPITYRFSPRRLFKKLLKGGSGYKFKDKYLGVYFDFKTDDGKSYLRALTATPVTLERGGGTLPQRGRRKVLKTEDSVVVEQRTYAGTRELSSEELRTPYIYRALENHFCETGFVLFTTKELEYLMMYTDMFYLSGCTISAMTLMDSENPEGRSSERDPFYSLKLEAPEVGSKGRMAEDNVRAPFVVGTPCAKKWYPST